MAPNRYRETPKSSSGDPFGLKIGILLSGCVEPAPIETIAVTLQRQTLY